MNQRTDARTRHAIDGRAYADAAGASGQSGDGFLYARCYVVARGRDFYEGVLADPRRMPASIDQWCEALLEADASAYEDATGDEWTYDASVGIETGSNTTLWT